MIHHNSNSKKLTVLDGEEIVISGFSGRFPESKNLNELRDNLMEKRDMITCDERRWQLDHPLIPKRLGKISDLEKFDAVFFGVHSKQAEAMDPQSRMLLEHTYEAIVDAGVNPKQLRGTKTGVFIGACLCESEKAWLYSEQDSGFGLTGCSRALFANRISYWLDLVGPSFAIDTACSSSLTAFEQAYRSIKDGHCDAAIVGGSNVCLEPYVAMQFFNLGTLSPDGRCKAWDESANGYVRSEALCVAFLQRAKNAKRIYATVAHCKINCDGYKAEGISHPSKSKQSALLRGLYAECGVSPSEVGYFEAHGTGTKVGDPEEIAAIDEVLGRSRCKDAPLLIGSVKTNLGHAEAASGLTSLAKVILAMESGTIPPNLHFKNCKKDLKAILEGRLQVVTDSIAWKGEYAAINNFGLGGANVHLLLRINPKEKINDGAPNDDLPRLVAVSGRTEEAVAGMLEDLERKPVDVEQLALLYSVHSSDINGHLYRGYTILSSSQSGIVRSTAAEIDSLSGSKRPVWFICSGMGSQWPGMGEALLRIPIFAEAIKKCDSVLRPYGIDIFHVITDKNQSVFDNILNCFVGITAIQIGLVDVLHSLGIKPDYIIGHSVGELGCAYEDGCLTAEQTIMSAYYRGLVSMQTKFVIGSMAAVGLGRKEIQNLLSSDIEIACHNSSNSSTISGPAESMKTFVAELKAKNIFAAEVPCSNIPFHSSYIAAAGPEFLANLKKIIPNPKLRSSKWVSTSIEMDKWDIELARYSSAEYFTNNLLNPVLFEETSTLIPKDAITIEIAPHRLLQTILKGSLPSSVTNIHLTQRNSKDNLEIFLKGVGKMFNAGLHPQLDKLYPPVTFPVSRGTPMISPMIRWEHKDDWFVSYFKDGQREHSGERVIKINIKNPVYETIAGHILNDRNLLPATSYLVMIWETFGMIKGKLFTELPVVFEDVKFLRATTFPKEGEVQLTLMIQKGTGRFEIVEGNTAVVTGIVRSTSESEVENIKWESNLNGTSEEEYMTSQDVYKEFKLRGYQYTGKFRSISKASENGSKAQIAWHDDWIAFIEIFFQLERKPVDVEQLALLYSVHSSDINGHLYRGYTILSSSQSGIVRSTAAEIDSLSGSKRPVWFICSGMGSQWPGMGEALLRIPIFAEAIKKCDSVLRPYGIDIFHVITDKNQSVFDNILNCFVGITAIQIGLVDVLHSLGIKPDYIIGHSVGELGCAYEDGCLTAEQTIMSAYYRGLVSMQTKFVIGSMAAVGLGRKEIQNLLSSDIEIACHNSSNSSTISGPAESMKTFVAELKAKNIFAAEVPCSNIPFHSSYIAAAGPEFLANLKKIIPNPKLRSSKWVSTSIEMDKWDIELARYSSAEYFTNNLLNPVLFEETSTLIPKDAITIEIAPHRLLQTILKGSLPSSVTNIHLTQRNSKDNLEIFLKGVGKMFNAGLHPQLDKLYPPVTFPVSRGTPMISPMIRWEHKDDWFVSYFKDGQREHSGERVIKINIKNPVYETIAGHILNDRNLLPATSYLVMIWETFGMIKGKLFTELPVVFEDVKFLRATTFPKEGEVQLTLMIQKGTGRFEIVEGNTAVVTGIVRSTSESEVENIKWESNLNGTSEEEYMTSQDVYKEFKLRGYQYTGKFRSISKASENGSKAQIAWHDDWIAFMDNMLQLMILAIDTRELFVPTAIAKIVIDANFHYAQVKCDESGQEFDAFYDKLQNVVFSGGIQILGLQARSITRRKFTKESVLEEYKFIPFVDETEMSLRDIAKIVTNIAVENHLGDKVKTVEVLDGSNESSFEINNLLSPWILESLEDIPMIQADVTIICPEVTSKFDTLSANISIVDIKAACTDPSALLVVGHRLLANDRTAELDFVLRIMKTGGFILTRENEILNFEDIANSKGFNIILKKKSGKETIILLRKKYKDGEEVLIINVHNDKFDWVVSMRKIMSEVFEKGKTNSNRLLFVGQDGFDNGLLGFINCLRREPGGEIVRGILIQDPTAPTFSLDHPLYSQQIEKDLAVSVLRESGIWGGYKYSQLPSLQTQTVYHYFLKQNIRGDLSSFSWIEGPLQPSYKHENLVNIIYSSINFKDIMLATGKLSSSSDTVEPRRNQESSFGLDYSGIDNLGKRIMGIIGTRALANICIVDPDLSWVIPENWSLEDAATVPCVYATCCYALYLKGNMKKGEKILIHAGAGGVGQAAITLALAEGCEVFTTVGTSEKRQFIKNTFPQIQDDHIGNSRDTSFERMIRKQTNGYGVDLVLNSLSEEKLLASINCLAWGGRFLEIGKFDLSADNPLGMKCFLREAIFHGIVLDHIFTAPKQRKLEMKALFERFLKSGTMKPLVRTVFSKDNIEHVFRYMAAGKHIGKVMITVQDENLSKNSQIAVPQYYCLDNRSYIVLGGLGGFGLELCDWLVMRGAKNIVITSRTGIKNGYQKMRVNLWKGYGVNVIIVSNKDASVYGDCQFIVETAAKLAPVDGIFNLAVVLKDALGANQTPENFEESFKPKVWATLNLDLITRKVCPELRNFVVFSSIFSGRGNAGQSNYGMSNSVVERICEKRVAEGLPGLAVQWGPIADVGLVANMQVDYTKELIVGGMLQQSIISCFEKLNQFLLQNRPVVSSIIVAEKKVIDSINILDSLLHIMCLKDLKGINLYSTLSELGMDSMMSVEIKQTLEREFGVFLSPQDIRNLTFSKLQEMSDLKNSCEKSQDARNEKSP